MKKPGDINRNGQKLLRISNEPGTDFNSRIWILECTQCKNVYGSNNTDAFQRKCPHCQKGAPGLTTPIERDGIDWTHEEHMLAFHLYNDIPFGTIHTKNPKLVWLAALLGRKVDSISMKLGNLARLDPIHQARGVKGLQRGAKGEKVVWEEFTSNPETFVLRAEEALAARFGGNLAEVADIETNDLPKAGLERDAIIKIRVNQSFFRRRILSAYNFRCCVTGLAETSLLTASHIAPWAEDEKNRLNPKNGLCLNALHDKAFDRHLMWIDKAFVVRFSPYIKEAAGEKSGSIEWLTQFEGRTLSLPKKFSPSSDLLELHAKKCMAKIKRLRA